MRIEAGSSLSIGRAPAVSPARGIGAVRIGPVEAPRATPRLFYKAQAIGEPVTGSEIAGQMPSDPQPDVIKSELVKRSFYPDGSYSNVVEELGKEKDIPSVQSAKSAVERIIARIKAVRTNTHQTTERATEKDVKTVLTPKPVILKSSR